MARAAWAGCLDALSVESDSEFFDLGGDSLRAMRLSAVLSEELGVHVPISLVFEKPVFEDFVTTLNEHKRLVRRNIVRHECVAAGDEGDFCCSIAQEQRLRVMPDGSIVCHAFNPYILNRVRGRLSVSLLQRSLAALLARHDALRVRVSLSGDEFRQRAIARPAIRPTIIKTASLSEHVRVAEVLDALTALARKPFDTRHEVMRVALGRLGHQDHLLLLCFSHAISDGRSLEIAVRDLSAIYRGLADARQPALPALRLTWGEWVVAQREWAAGRDGLAAIEYWRRKLIGSSPIPEIRHPAELRVPPTELRGAAASQHAFFANGHVERLEQFARDHRATLYMVLLTTLKTLIAEETGRTDIGIVTPFAARRLPAWHELVGWLAFSVPLRTDMDWGVSFAERLDRVRMTVLEAHENAISYPIMIGALSPDLVGSRLRRPTVVLALDDERNLRLDLPDATCELVELPDDTWSHPGLYWFLTRSDQGLRLKLKYETQALPEHVAQELVDKFNDRLRDIG